MHKLGKYYKPFTFWIIISMIILFIEVMCDLKLPNYMSKIVNVGIQSSGIENVTPTYVTTNGMELMKIFMNDAEKEFVEKSYWQIAFGKPNPYKVDTVYSLKQNIKEEDLEKLDKIFSRSAKSLINICEKIALEENSTIDTQKSFANATQNSNTVKIELDKMYEILPYISNISEEIINEAKKNALETDETTLTSIGTMFTKSMYEEIGIDIGKIQMQYILRIGAKMLGIALLGAICFVTVGFLASKIGAGVGKNLRKDVFEKVQSFSTEEFNNFSSASLITRTTNDITQIQNIVVMAIRMFSYAPVMGIGALIMMAQTTTKLLWTIIVACVAIIILIIILFKTVLPKIKIVQKLTDRINLVAKESLSGMMVVRAFGTQKYEENRFDETNTEVMKTNKFINRSMVSMMPFMTFIMNGVNLLILCFGASLIQKATIQVGDLMAAMQYGIEVVMSFLMTSMIFVTLPRASVSANRIVEVLDTKTSINDPENAKEFKKDKKGYVEFKNVSFKYPDADEKILENISFIAKPGETTAIIGSTGSGKSSIVNLIPRLFDVTEGEVLVNGVNVKDVKQADLHNEIGYIPQKGSLLSGSISENLKYGNLDATDEFMKKCAEIAQASEFIEDKEDGYESLISQGAKNVSGGQKQRLSIARALVKNSPIYIFDDSFSALDFKTDSNLRKALKEYAGNSTLIIVAQRVSTIMNAEQILVLEKGKIVGKGTHKELLKKCPTYYEIASSQLTKEELES